MSYNARSNQNFGNRASSSYSSSVKNLNNLPDPDDDTAQIIDKCFSRKYSYKNFHPTELWTLPENDEIIFTSNSRWNDEELQDLKGKLNHVKERLSEFDIKQWQVYRTGFYDMCTKFIVLISLLNTVIVCLLSLPAGLVRPVPTLAGGGFSLSIKRSLQDKHLTIYFSSQITHNYFYVLFVCF